MVLNADVIVIGAGPAGLCAAAELHRHGLGVILLERQPHPRAGSRAIGIHAPVLAALEPSGVTDALLAQGVPVRRGLATAAGRPLGEVRFDRSGLRHPFALALPQSATEAALAAAAPDPALGMAVTRVTDRGSHAEVAVRAGTDERTVTAHAVVVAAGAAGRDLLPVQPRNRWRHDRFVMADFRTAGEPEETAVITLTAAGVLESFPLPEGRRRLVAQLDPGAERAEADPTALLQDALCERGSAHLAPDVGEAQTFGIRRVLLPKLRLGRLFAIGDAAHEVSPIGGQGMNLGLLDAVTLAPALSSWLRQHDAAAITAWERRRLVSAQRAARLADLNTRLGRAQPSITHRATTLLVAAALATPAAPLAARAFSMGYDLDAQALVD